MRILVLHGPNLNLLGEREPKVYGTSTLLQLNRALAQQARQRGATLRFFQSNHEGALIDAIHKNRRWMDGLVINPAALAHTSYALRDAICAVAVRSIEVHLSDIRRREAFRRVSVIAPVCEAQRFGKGLASYHEAIDLLVGRG